MIGILLGVGAFIFVAILAVAYYAAHHVARLELDGRHVIITGASEGLGLSLACQLAAKGAHITMISRSQEKLNAALPKVQQSKKSDVRLLPSLNSSPKSI